MSATVNGRVTRTVARDDLTILDETNPRANMNRERVDMFAAIYAERGPDGLPPITVAESPDGTLYLVGGRHRVVGAEIAGLDDMPAIMTALAPGVDQVATVLRLAVEEDSRSALPLTSAEKRAVIRMLFRFDPSANRKELARIVGVTDSFVRNALDDDYVKQIERGVRKSGTAEYASEAAKKIIGGLRHYQTRGLLDSLRAGAPMMPNLLADLAYETLNEDAYELLDLLNQWTAKAMDQYEDPEPDEEE